MSIKVVGKAWGKELWLVNNEKYCAKYLIVKPGWQCSLHKHVIKDETFLVIRGECDLELEGKSQHLKFWESQRIQPGQWHRFSNPSEKAIVILEMSTTHSDFDVERAEVSGPIASHSKSPSPKNVSINTLESVT